MKALEEARDKAREANLTVTTPASLYNLALEALAGGGNGKGKTFGEELRSLVCPKCHQYPCVCDWDPEKETMAEFKQRVYGRR